MVNCDETTIEKICRVEGGNRGAKSKEKEDIKPMMMRNIRQTFLCLPFLAHHQKKRKAPPRNSTRPALSYALNAEGALLLNLGQNLRILKEEKFLHKEPISHEGNQKKKEKKDAHPLRP